jgi:hypothetical protein
MDVDRIGEPASRGAEGVANCRSVRSPGAGYVRRSANKGVINMIDSIIYDGVAVASKLLRSAWN